MLISAFGTLLLALIVNGNSLLSFQSIAGFVLLTDEALLLSFGEQVVSELRQFSFALIFYDEGLP